MKLAGADLEFMRSLGRALLALLASALILIVSFLAYHYSLVPQQSNAAASLSVAGSQFETMMGTTRLQGDALVLERLDAEGALLSRHIGLRTQDYPFVRYHFEGLQPGLTLQFFWRTEDGSMFAASIPRSGRKTYVNLSSLDAWRGTVTDIGLNVTGDLRNQNLIIPGLSFEAYSWQGIISAVLSEWTEFRGWTGASINILWGTPGGRTSATLSPTMAMASWAGVALVLLYGMSLIQGRKSLISYCAVVLIPWIALDQLWQSELSTQLQETRLVFGGKTTHQKHLADLDSDIYGYAKRLKEDVLPPSVARIIILSAEDQNNYVPLKTLYYLLPHNIYAHSSQPPSQGIKPGDYILVLGFIPGLRYLSSQEVLAWEPDSRLNARLVDTDKLGQLFHVMPAASGITEVPARTTQD